MAKCSLNGSNANCDRFYVAIEEWILLDLVAKPLMLGNLNVAKPMPSLCLSLS
jgi:hypothetical protein